MTTANETPVPIDMSALMADAIYRAVKDSMPPEEDILAAVASGMMPHPEAWVTPGGGDTRSWAQHVLLAIEDGMARGAARKK